MKIKLGALRLLVREELARLSEGSWRVTYTEKDGSPGKPRVFGGDNAEKLARMYARGVKNGVAEPDTVEAPAADVQRVRPAGLDDLKASAKAYYNKHWNPHKGSGAPGPWRREEDADAPWSAENAAEREGEMWAAGRAAGQSREDTQADIDDMYSRRR